MTSIELPPADPAARVAPNPPEIQAAVPHAITNPNFVPKERYYDRAFFELEKEHLWPKSWLMAAREEEIPFPGDYTEFEVAGNSILIVRQKDGKLTTITEGTENGWVKAR